MSRRTGLRSPLYVATLLSAFFFSACHSYHIDATIENRTGAPIQLLEVDYPSASFGIDSLAPAANFHYRFQVRGSGQLKVSYTSANGQTIQISGPTLAERQQGKLEIVLEPGGKAEFHPQLTPPA
ncbi:MAG: hypothetical protein ABR860_17900 [Terracidiphilus sp.]